MSVDIKNKILRAASEIGSMEQHISYDLLPYVEEMYADGLIQYVLIDIDDVKNLQVMLLDKGVELLHSGGYK